MSMSAGAGSSPLRAICRPSVRPSIEQGWCEEVIRENSWEGLPKQYHLRWLVITWLNDQITSAWGKAVDL